jgi:hypothetical protein
MVKQKRCLFRSAECAGYFAAQSRIPGQKNAHRLQVGTTQEWDQTEIGAVHHVKPAHLSAIRHIGCV